MPDKIYRKVDLVGTSTESVEDAIKTAVTKATNSLGPVDWFEVDEIRGKVEAGTVQVYQVTVTLGVRVEG
ncbi:MAG: dodecin flavoprotein [Alphaproteobacteria bacterium]|jgi:flavin-binding protein dodecin|nr:dodecin flavoprotein [Alphaproteobacteria bacterium]